MGRRLAARRGRRAKRRYNPQDSEDGAPIVDRTANVAGRLIYKALMS